MAAQPSSRFLFILLNNFSLLTWILIGASLQSLLVLCLPHRVALLPAAFLLLLRIVHTALASAGWIQNPHLRGVRAGRWTAPLLNQDGSIPDKGADKEVVVFLVAASVNHPLGLFAPGFKETGDHLSDLWTEAESNREKWGFLGKSSPLVTTQDNGGYVIMNLSYWKSFDHLHAFAHAEAHRRVWDWWKKTIKQHAHIGIMHETYSVPSGQWENVYENFHPITMGETKHLLPAPKPGSPTVGERLISPLVEAKRVRWTLMLNRGA